MLSKKSSPFLDNMQNSIIMNEVILDILVTYEVNYSVKLMDRKPILQCEKCHIKVRKGTFVSGNALIYIKNI